MQAEMDGSRERLHVLCPTLYYKLCCMTHEKHKNDTVNVDHRHKVPQASVQTVCDYACFIIAAIKPEASMIRSTDWNPLYKYAQI